jgi:signal transduction histidine kinase
MVAFISQDIAGILHFLGLVPAGLLAKWLWDDRKKPGVQWFLVATIAAAVWSVASGCIALLDSTAGTLLFHNVRFFVVVAAAASWFLLALEYTYKESVPTKWFYYLLIVPSLTQVLSVVSPELVFSRAVDSQGLLQYTYGPWFIFDQFIYGFGLVAVGSSLWIGDALMSRGTRRRQTIVLLLATICLLVTSLLLAVGWPTSYVDVSVLGIIAAESLIGFAFKRYSLLQISPVAREAVVREMDDAAFILNSNDVVTDLNPAARQLLDGGDDLTGRPAADIFGEHEDLLAALSGTSTLETTISLRIRGTDRHFALGITPVMYGRGLQGRSLVLRDVTELKDREEELDLLKQILARVFRHNVRNKLSPIKTYAEMIAARTTGELNAYARRIDDGATRLNRQSKKVSAIERVTGTDRSTEVVLSETVAAAVAETVKSYPNASIDSRVSDIRLQVNPRLQLAIEELLDNAIRHNDEAVTVDIYTERRANSVVLCIDDTGAGIPEAELDVLRSGEETALQHVSGVGLWLVRYVVRRSSGTLSIESTAGGTSISLEFPTGESQSSTPE